ncbi:MAG: hypothetical protein ACJAVR_001679 [Paracoccaceae bacterium]|jgi:hypothetical protein
MSVAARLDILAFGSIRAASSVVSFFGAFYLVAIGSAEVYGLYLAMFSTAGIIATMLRMGADHSLLRLSRVPLRARLSADPRLRLLRGWGVVWVGALALALIAWAADLPLGLRAFEGVLMSLSMISGRFLRSCQRPRAAALFDPPFMHLFGVGLLCLGAAPELAIAAGLTLWLTVGVAMFARTMGLGIFRDLARAKPWIAARPRRLSAVYITYLIETGFGNGINLMIEALHGAAALAVYNTVMKVNFVSEQAQEFQSVFRIDAGRAAPPVSPVSSRPKALVKRALARFDVPRDAPGSGAGEIAFFAGLSVLGNAAILLFLLKADFAVLPVWLFFVLITGFQTFGLIAGPAIFAIWVFRSVTLSNAMRATWVAAFAACLVLLPPAPEMWAVANIALLAILRYCGLRAWKAGLGRNHAQRV